MVWKIMNPFKTGFTERGFARTLSLCFTSFIKTFKMNDILAQMCRKIERLLLQLSAEVTLLEEKHEII